METLVEGIGVGIAGGLGDVIEQWPVHALLV